MKKKLITLSIVSIISAVNVAALDVVGGAALLKDTADNLVFKAGEDGKSYVYVDPSQKEGQVRNLKQDANGAYVGSITVDSGVEGIMNFSTLDMPYSSGYDTAGFRFGGSSNTVNGSALISGAGKDVSTFSFYGVYFDTGHIADATAAGKAQDTMTIKDITFNFNSTASSSNWIGSNYMVLDNAVLNINSGRLRMGFIKNLTLTNSTLNIDTTTAPDSLATGCSIDFNGINIIKGSGAIKFGGYNAKDNSKVATVYAYASNMYFSGITSDSAKNVMYFGEGENGETYDIILTTGGNVQVNLGIFSIKAKDKSVVTVGGDFNLASSERAYIGKGVELTAFRSRIIVGSIDGKVSINAGYQNANTWNYTFALGVLGDKKNNTQVADVIFGENAEINVVGNAEKNIGKNFTITGSVVSNAGTGKIVSDVNGGFLIRSNTHDSSHVSVLTLNTTDAFAVGGAATQGESTFLLDTKAKVKIVANAGNSIGAIDFASGAILTLDLALANSGEGDNLWIKDFTGSVSNITLEHFADNKLRIGEDIISDAMKALTFVVDGEIWTFGENYNFVEAKDGGFFVNAVVPEPAEWAMIFGAIALVFALRKRFRA